MLIIFDISLSTFLTVSLKQLYGFVEICINKGEFSTSNFYDFLYWFTLL